ncbi:MAG TPA: pseudouridine synthase [Acidobacteriota bacterium]|nr:pseudouridine synthase [Acidobacteriota bacterium]
MTSTPQIIMLHKPKGVVVTRSDELGRKTIYDILPDWVRQQGWLPVGRLDQDSRGLLLLVQDGSLIDPLTKPGRFPKVYEVWVRGHVSTEHLKLLQGGVQTSIGVLKCDRVEILGMVLHKTHLYVTLVEGKNRHIRRMYGALRDPERNTPLKVLELKRTQFGPIQLDVESGKWRHLESTEISDLLQAAGRVLDSPL